MDSGTIVKVQRRNDYQEEQADPDVEKYHLPLVILQNGSSASASEILTAALQDNGRRVVREELRVIQAVMPSSTKIRLRQDEVKSALAITIGSYLTPNGDNIHGEGIEPNVWYDATNQMQEDAELRRLQDELDAKREEMRQIRSEMANYVREHDAPLSKASEIATRLLAGEELADGATGAGRARSTRRWDTALPSSRGRNRCR
jgi:C-terminal processing protease CtpA/Prc